MKARHTFAPLALAIAAFLVYAGAVFAQHTAPGTAAFQRLDRNRDERLTRDEVPSADSFAAADTDKNGVVTIEEFRRYLAKRPGVDVKVTLLSGKTKTFTKIAADRIRTPFMETP